MSTVDYVALAFLIAAVPLVRRNRGYATILACVGLALPLAGFAEAMMSTVFMLYDDEGYVLHTIKSFVDGGALYDRVYSQYGPMLYVFWKFLSLIGIGPTHDNGRLLTLVLWLLSAGLCGGVAWRLCRNGVAAMAAFTGSVVTLWMCANEPSHPGALVCVLACAAGFIVSARRPLYWSESLVLGLLCAALLLTKINTGVFLVAALGAWWAIGAFRDQWRAVAWLVVGVAVALPWVLMRPSLAEPAMRQFALISSLSLLAVLLVILNHAPRAPQGLRPLPTLLGLVGGVALMIVFMLAQGSSLSALYEGIILRPLAHPGSFNIAVYWRSGSLVLALLAPALALLLILWQRKVSAVACAPVDKCTPFFVSGCAVVIFVAFKLSVAEVLGVTIQAILMSYGMACAWLLVWPCGEADDGAYARRALALVMLFQALHAYPVAVTQIGWGMVLWVPLASAVAIPWVWGLIEGAGVGFSRSVLRWSVLVLAVSSLFFIAARHEHLAVRRKQVTLPLGLPGAQSLRLPVHTVAALRVMVANAGGEGDVLFSVTGMYSFNLWTGARTPTSRNVTQWHRLLTEEEQAEILAQLRANPKARIIRNRPLCDYLAQHGFPLAGPLAEAIQADYVPVFGVAGLELLERPDSSVTQRRRPGILSRDGARLRAYLPREWVSETSSFSLYQEASGVATFTKIARAEVVCREEDGFWLVDFAAEGRPVLVVRDQAGKATGFALFDEQG